MFLKFTVIIVQKNKVELIVCLFCLRMCMNLSNSFWFWLILYCNMIIFLPKRLVGYIYIFLYPTLLASCFFPTIKSQELLYLPILLYYIRTRWNFWSKGKETLFMELEIMLKLRAFLAPNFMWINVTRNKKFPCYVSLWALRTDYCFLKKLIIHCDQTESLYHYYKTK